MSAAALIMNQNAISMTSDNSRNRKQANRRGAYLYSHLSLRALICSRGGGVQGPGKQARAALEKGEGHGVEGGAVCERVKFPSLVACCFPLLCQAPLNLLHHSNMVPSITGTMPSMQSAEERRGEAGTYKQDKRPHKRPAAT